MTRPLHRRMTALDIDGDAVLDDASAFTGNPVFSGNPSFTGTPTFSNALTFSGGFKTSTGDVLGVTQDTAISSAEVLALNGTPKVVVTAPGANKIAVPRMFVLFMDYNSTAYDGVAAGEDFNIRYVGTSQWLGEVEATGFIDQTSDQYAIGSVGNANLQSLSGNVTVNTAIELTISAGEIATGNSPIGCRVVYDIIDASTLAAS